MRKKKPIEALALKYVYSNIEESRFQITLKMTRLYGHKMTHNAINNAFDVQKMVDPTFQRFI